MAWTGAVVSSEAMANRTIVHNRAFLHVCLCVCVCDRDRELIVLKYSYPLIKISVA